MAFARGAPKGEVRLLGIAAAAAYAGSAGKDAAVFRTPSIHPCTPQSTHLSILSLHPSAHQSIHTGGYPFGIEPWRFWREQIPLRPQLMPPPTRALPNLPNKAARMAGPSRRLCRRCAMPNLLNNAARMAAPRPSPPKLQLVSACAG
eukprot:259810-Chlamydomonas_euryale.AAC.9